MGSASTNLIEMKEAVARAKAFVLDLFADENIENVELDEVDFLPREKNWFVVVSFQKAIDKDLKSPLAIALQRVARERKTVRVSSSGDVLSVTNFRPLRLQ